MITYLIIAATVCLLPVILVKLKIKGLPSISDSAYQLGRSVYFTLWAIISGISILPLWLEVSPVNYQFLAFLSVVALGVVGLTPNFKTTQAVQHFVSAGVCVSLSILWSTMVGVWFFPIIFIVLSMIGMISWNEKYDTEISNPSSGFDKFMNEKLGIGDFIYWLELGAITSIFASILIYMLFSNLIS